MGVLWPKTRDVVYFLSEISHQILPELIENKFYPLRPDHRSPDLFIAASGRVSQLAPPKFSKFLPEFWENSSFFHRVREETFSGRISVKYVSQVNFFARAESGKITKLHHRVNASSLREVPGGLPLPRIPWLSGGGMSRGMAWHFALRSSLEYNLQHSCCCRGASAIGSVVFLYFFFSESTWWPGFGPRFSHSPGPPHLEEGWETFFTTAVTQRRHCLSCHLKNQILNWLLPRPADYLRDQAKSVDVVSFQYFLFTFEKEMHWQSEPNS